MSHNRVAATFIALLLLSVGCSSTPPGAAPHDMSAEDHRKHAADEDELAEAHQRQFDPNASGEVSVGTSEFAYGVSVYNPTGHHSGEAAEHRSHAEAHREAAKKLETFEDAACGKLPPQTRAVCPLLGPIASAEATPEGVRIELADGVNREALLAHMKCHVAFAATHGHDGMDTCPLYVEGVVVGEQGSSLTITASKPEAIKAVKERTATHVR